ncbi:MAG: adenylate/guanylate cyclase domain-containing protein [Candidatus Electrothrix scaldis]|nr:MAG: adenylate/guanylate cyclase domain-containing protein [Candidatus Electrothrix sp. GW3-3]
MDRLKDEFSNALLGRLRLRFHEKKLEASFLEDYRKFWHRQSIRYLKMLIFLLPMVWVVLKFLNESFLNRFAIVLAGIFVVSLFIIVCTQLWPTTDSTQLGHFEIFSDAVNISFSFFYIALLTPEAEKLGLPVKLIYQSDTIYVPLIFIIIHLLANFILIPNRFIHSLVVGAFTVATSVIVIVFFSQLSIANQSTFIIFLFLIFIMLLQSGFQRERKYRETFYQWQLVEQQKKEIAAEREKSESLLLNILPAPIAEQLKKNPGTIVDAFPETTVLFSDIVGFTKLSQTVTPDKLVNLLNNLFSRFDDLAENHGLEKIKTIGDAYMAAAGLPEHRVDHAEATAYMALDMCREMIKFNEKIDTPLNIRIGINSGAVVAGVIGKKKFIYDLWGDAVNTAARMESHGVPGEIQVTATTYELLKEKFKLESRGDIEVKGKGVMEVWLLKGTL